MLLYADGVLDTCYSILLCVGDNVNTLCVAPRNVDRADFFSSFVSLLQDQPEVSDLRVSI